MKLEGRFRPNLASNPAGISYPPTLHKPLPLPSKPLYPWWGSRIELNKGQGRSAVTPGLPLPITTCPKCNYSYQSIRKEVYILRQFTNNGLPTTRDHNTATIQVLESSSTQNPKLSAPTSPLPSSQHRCLKYHIWKHIAHSTTTTTSSSNPIICHSPIHLPSQLFPISHNPSCNITCYI